MPSVLIFSQSPGGYLDTPALSRHALKFFSLDITTVAAQPSLERCSQLQLRLGQQEHFQIKVRPTTAVDLARAHSAEQRGRASGMASLAARCAHVWQLQAQGPVAERSSLLLQALLASVALGPVLPPTTSTLYGVRGARELASRCPR